MALNQCCECDEFYNETKSNPGSLCPKCKQLKEEENEKNSRQEIEN